MKNMRYYFLLILGMLCFVSCGDDSDTPESPMTYIGEWKGQYEVYYSEEEDAPSNMVTVEYSLSTDGRFEQKFSGMKYTDEDKGDGYEINRGSYTVKNDTLFFSFDYNEYHGDSNSDVSPYVDKKESDGNWYRTNLTTDGEAWDKYSSMFPEESPQFVKVSTNKYKIVYLYGEDSWRHEGKVVWKMSSPNSLSIYTYREQTLMYSMSRK